MQCCASAQGNFNKMAFIKKMLANTPRADAEWIWWTGGQTPFSMVAHFPVFSHFLMWMFVLHIAHMPTHSLPKLQMPPLEIPPAAETPFIMFALLLGIFCFLKSIRT